MDYPIYEKHGASIIKAESETSFVAIIDDEEDCGIIFRIEATPIEGDAGKACTEAEFNEAYREVLEKINEYGKEIGAVK